MDDAPSKPSIENLVDLFVYAPIGLVYEYPEVMDRLVKRGKSQAQLARVMAQMAARQGTSGAQHGLDVATADVARAVARLVTEVGVKVGLAPDPSEGPVDAAAASTESAAADSSPATPAASGEAGEEANVPAEEPAPIESTPATSGVSGDSAADLLPIAGYDELKARQIVDLLGELEPEELERIRAFEAGHRHRKTVLGKIATLLGET